MTRPATQIALAAAVVLTSAVAAHAADTHTPGIDWRQAQEQQRIQEGRRSGQLSPAEYRALEAQQSRIARDERIAKADGYVSPAERARLNRELDKASADITRLKSNRETASNAPWYRRWW